MVAKGNEGESQKEIVFVESDFLFGLRRSDVRHSHVVHALNNHKQDRFHIEILSSAVIEARTVLASRGLEPKTIEELLSLMAALLGDYGVSDFVPLGLGDVMLAERMRSQWPELSFFDSLHAATSKAQGRKLLSSEGIYKKIGLEVIDLDSI
jgi:predicted nucleic acid-binding protein